MPPSKTAVDAPLELEMFLPYRLAIAATAVSQALADVYSERFGISVAEWRIIANLGRFGPLNAGELAERSTLDKPRVTRALQRLKIRRLVSRTIAKADRRQIRIALTGEGNAVFGAVAALARTWEADLLATLSASERKALDSALSKLTLRARDLRAL